MRVIERRSLLGAAALLALAACNRAGGGASAIGDDDVVLGAADAPVTLIEYASSTCPNCARFHADVWERLKENYIDTGKVRFVYRETPAHEPAVALAGFQIARCGGTSPEQYFVRLAELYRQQEAIFATGTAQGARDKLIEIGAAAGLSQEQAAACINDEAGPARMARLAEGGRRFNVTGTPTVILNGRKIQTAAEMTYEGLAAAIDAELAR